ncbi:hypothetical protein LTR09_002825 [Extremus antarcticus]|uniref:Uncharacterized protein n=1 Tax=Extremus antarcticus TaxID=702011 RepID=A0AAJ0GF52_9PEZI|nr:hypothetical protein LTR09_002825 [Extremus antarcticus]
MSRGFAAFGVALAGLCGVGIMYSTLRPELENQAAERRGEFKKQHGDGNEHALSQAIASDFKEAGQQLKPTPNKGFAWGIREAIWGSPKGQPVDKTVHLPTRSQEEMQESPMEVVHKAKSADREGG